MEAKNYMMCLLGSMDRLWFHQIILSPHPPLFHPTQDSDYPAYSSEYSSKIGQEIPSTPQDENSSQESDDLDDKRERDRESTRLNLEKTESFSRSQEKSRNIPRLRKSVSCKSLIELELEEVRGFIDLGFNFRRENLSNHIISLLPGLQRFDKYKEINAKEEEEEEEEEDVVRPYLSESWIIRKPDSPLLNLRMPRLCSAADMKKHLKFWAQTVASDVQES